MKQQALQLIENIKNDPEFNNINVHEGILPSWEYCFLVSGFNGGKYFHLEISKLKNYEKKHIEVSTLTECKPEIKEKLKQFKIQ